MTFSVTTKQGGQCMAQAPDTCKVPTPAGPVPTPFPNMADTAQADAGKCTKKVKCVKKPVLHKNSEIPMSSGDEAGSAGGVVSGKIKGEVLFRKFSAKVKVEGNGLIYQTCTTSHNGKSPNCPMGMQAAPSQGKVKVLG